ncbi:MAG: Na+/H+ antiporter NhaA [Nitrosospira sp.]
MRYWCRQTPKVGQWGVPMATDTAFAVVLIAMMGRRVPVELRIFLTAAAIVDDIGAIVVVAIFYSDALHGSYLAGAAAITRVLVLFNRGGIYRSPPYVLLGVGLWICVHASGIHATLAGVILAFVIPTWPPPNLGALMKQADAILTAESQRADKPSSGTGLRSPPWKRWTPSTTGWNRRPNACSVMSRRGQATWCCRFSPWSMRA